MLKMRIRFSLLVLCENQWCGVVWCGGVVWCVCVCGVVVVVVLRNRVCPTTK
jgi:hypothetical protein